MRALAGDPTVRWLVIGFTGLALAGFLLPGWIVNNVMFGLARGLAVLGLLVLWRTGLVSFGHALYFGLGAYSVALLEQLTGVTELLPRLACAVAVAGGAGWIVGFVLRRYRGIFFAMLSLAFSMALYGILVKMESLGSTDGFSVSPTVLFGRAPETRHAFLVTLVAVCAFAAVAVQAYLVSALGHLTAAVRDNEIRVEYLGYPVARSIHTTYVLSAVLAGAAGGLMAMALGQVDPDSMVNWTVSAELVFIAIMAGAGNVAAPFIGGVVFEFLRTYAFELAPHAWQLIVGATLLAIIFFLPHGIWSLIERPWKTPEKRHG